LQIKESMTWQAARLVDRLSAPAEFLIFLLENKKVEACVQFSHKLCLVFILKRHIVFHFEKTYCVQLKVIM